jgi:rhodanese-related sulfurtransferase
MRRIERKENIRSASGGKGMRQKKTGSIFTVIVIVVLMGMPGKLWADEVQPISLQELRTRLDSGEEIALVNPLTDILFNEGHIPGSVNVPLGEIRHTNRLPNDRGTLIVTYCLGPKSAVSKEAAGLVAMRGYRQVRWFREGIQAWAAAGYTLAYGDVLPRIPVSGVNAAQLRGRLQEVVVLDIRPPSLYEAGWISGSRKMPIDGLSKRYVELPKGTKIVVVDQMGDQVIVAARFLEQKGYEVQGLQGGIVSWVSEGYPIEK